MVEVGLAEKLADFFPNGKVKDSKKLSPKKREEIFERIVKAKETARIFYSVSFSSPKLIDEKGLTNAINSALADCLKSLDAEADNCQVLLDGGLKAPKEFKNQKTIIKGDEKEAIIALASITAKVSRDKEMVLLHEKYPEYDFAKHKGYGTKSHYAKIKRHGISPIHRRSFLKKLLKQDPAGSIQQPPFSLDYKPK
jgi:ribonuclease HII